MSNLYRRIFDRADFDTVISACRGMDMGTSNLGTKPLTGFEPIFRS